MRPYNIDRQLAQLDEDRHYYFRKLADAANDEDRERYLTALIGRLKLSGDVGLLYKDDADRLIENIPSDVDIFTYNREFANDPGRAQRLLLYGAYPNIRPELREALVKKAQDAVGHLPVMEAPGGAQTDVQPDETDISEQQESPEQVSETESRQEEESQARKPENLDANGALNREFTTEGIEKALRQHEAEGNSQSNNSESSASNGEGGGFQRIAAAVGKEQGKAQKRAQPGKAAASASDKVKVNELGTGAEGQRSQQNRPRMSDVLPGDKPEGAVMNDEKENRPQPTSQASETPSGPPPMKFDSRTEKYISELHPDVAALAREHLTRIVAANTGYQVKIVKAYRSYVEQEDEYAKAASVIRARLSLGPEPVKAPTILKPHTILHSSIRRRRRSLRTRTTPPIKRPGGSAKHSDSLGDSVSLTWTGFISN